MCHHQLVRHSPHTLGMEYYSASLWHLEKATELSVLADDLRHADTLRPETWCVMGNLMSLTKDHEAAIKFIERAIQVIFAVRNNQSCSYI